MTFERYISKNTLYTIVDEKIRSLGITHNDYPLDSINLAKTFEQNITIEYYKFKSFSICGMLYKGNNISTIFLNSLRSSKGHNFDCMHELMHYWFHNPADIICCDKSISQHKGREWQANEAAAQALMPVGLFLQKYYEYNGNKGKLSDYFYVGETSIEYRIQNLKSEILKYSLKKLCSNCHNIVLPNKKYCTICGCNSFIKGDKHMHYNDGYKLDETSRVFICPVCSNEDIDYRGNYCNVCGTYLVNECTNSYSCGRPSEFNARFCCECGSETTFYSNKLLKSWNNVLDFTNNPSKLRAFNSWPAILQELKDSGRMMLRTYLQNTFAFHLDNKLYIGFLDENSSLINNIYKPEYINIIRTLVSKYIIVYDVILVDEDWLTNMDVDTELLRESLEFKTKKIKLSL